MVMVRVWIWNVHRRRMCFEPLVPSCWCYFWGCRMCRRWDLVKGSWLEEQSHEQVLVRVLSASLSTVMEYTTSHSCCPEPASSAFQPFQPEGLYLPKLWAKINFPFFRLKATTVMNPSSSIKEKEKRTKSYQWEAHSLAEQLVTQRFRTYI